MGWIQDWIEGNSCAFIVADWWPSVLSQWCSQFHNFAKPTNSVSNIWSSSFFFRTVWSSFEICKVLNFEFKNVWFTSWVDEIFRKDQFVDFICQVYFLLSRQKFLFEFRVIKKDQKHHIRRYDFLGTCFAEKFPCGRYRKASLILMRRFCLCPNFSFRVLDSWKPSFFLCGQVCFRLRIFGIFWDECLNCLGSLICLNFWILCKKLFHETIHWIILRM